MDTIEPKLAYPIHDRTLQNGLRVLVSPDEWSPVVAVNLWYHVGSGDEVLGRTGFAHLFEHLMFQGSAHVASGEHLSALQAVGGSVNGTTSFDRTNYFEAVPAGAFDLALWFEADRLASLLERVDQGSLDTQREVVKEERRQRYDNVPYGDVFESLLTLTFPAAHPYGHSTIGSMSDLDAATLDDVHAFFATHYRPSNAVLSLVGAMTPDDAFARADRFFGGIPFAPAPLRRVTDPLEPMVGVPRAEVTKDVPRDALYLTWRLPASTHPDTDAIELGLAVLADGLTSRLHRALVRTDLAESARAFAMTMVQGNAMAIASITCRLGVDPARVETALGEACAAFLAEGPTPDEHSRAITQLSREWLSELSALDSRADALGESATLFGDPGRINTRLARLSNLTPEHVREACARWLRVENRAVLSYLYIRPVEKGATAPAQISTDSTNALPGAPERAPSLDAGEPSSTSTDNSDTDVEDRS